MESTNISSINSPQKGKRIYYFDNLKIALTCLVVAHHASQGYFSVDTGWPIQQANLPEINDRLIGWFLSVNNAFFMALFFMISAYFIPSSLERKTTSEFLRDRLRRLGIPIIVITCVVFPFTGFLLNGQGMSFREFAFKHYFKLPDGEINLGQTWFLLVLLGFTCLYLLYIRFLKGKLPIGKVIIASQQEEAHYSVGLKNVHILLFAIGLTVITFVVRIYFKPGYWTILHILEPARILTYFAMFIFGILAYRKKWFEKLSVSTGILWGVISVVIILLAPPIILYRVGGLAIWAAGFTLNSFIVSVWETFLCVGLCISLPILFRQKFNATGKVLKMASKNSFGVYLIHPFVLIPMEAAILNLPIYPFVKFILVSIIAIIVCYSICYLYTTMKSFLSRKFSRR